jgi:PAS domain S-box-containing protein
MQIVSKDGEILFMNDVFRDLLSEDKVGKKCWEIYHDGPEQCHDCPLKTGIVAGESQTKSTSRILKGKTYNVHHTGMTFKSQPAMLEIFIDITDREEITQELRRSEKQFRELFGNMEQGFAVHEMIYDKNGVPIDYRYIMVNDAFETLTGIPGVDIVGKTIKETVPDIEQYWIDDFGKVAKSGKPEQFENYFSYSKKYFNVTAYSPKKDTFAVVFYDVTDYKEKEKELEERRKFQESVLNITPCVIYIYDLVEKKNVYLNDGIEDVLGYTKEEVKGMGDKLIETLMHPRDYKEYLNVTLPKYKKLKDKKLKHNYRMKHKNGRYVSLLAIEVIYKKDDKGRPTQIIGTIIKA